MSSGSGYAGRHRDPVPPVAGSAATGQSHQLLWLVGGAAAVVLLLFSVLVYPTVAGNQSPPTGGRPVTSSTSERGLQFLGAQEGGGTGTPWPSSTSTRPPVPGTSSTAEPAAPQATTPTSAVATPPAEVPAPPPPEATSSTTEPSTTRSAAPETTTPSVSSSTPLTTESPDNPRAVAHALFPDFGFPDNEFGCLNAAWNRLGLWSTAAAVRPGLIYLKGRYGTPCDAWDHVRRTGSY